MVPILEIDPEVDFDSRRAVYFRQMRYGLYVCFPQLIHNAPLIFCDLDSNGVARKCNGLSRCLCYLHRGVGVVVAENRCYTSDVIKATKT